MDVISCRIFSWYGKYEEKKKKNPDQMIERKDKSLASYEWFQRYSGQANEEY